MIRDQDVGSRQYVRGSAVAFDPEGQHVRMLDQEQDVFDAAGPPFLDQLSLQRQRFGVGYESQVTDV